MKKNVPEALRRAALRKLWKSDPILANLDGLNDYDEDYNLVDTAITAAQTAYKVGKGYLDEIGEKLAQLDESNAAESGESPSRRPNPQRGTARAMELQAKLSRPQNKAVWSRKKLARTTIVGRSKFPKTWASTNRSRCLRRSIVCCACESRMAGIAT